uniref:Uncharacterized protein n=1 Tax=Anguilla anguilla TaxID=7936 RepID=A0A0E9RYT7_ANGAN
MFLEAAFIAITMAKLSYGITVPSPVW